MNREDVENQLAQAAKFSALKAAGMGSRVPVDPDELRALCERWLAVQNVPVAEIDSSGELVTLIAEGSGLDNSLLSAHIDTLRGQRVHLVVVAGNGGGDE